MAGTFGKRGFDILTFVEFRSDRFPAYDGEEEQINPGRWGKRLAEFLRDGLSAEGFQTEDPISEDWGWVLPVVNPEFDLRICCGVYQEYPDGFLCFIEPNTPSIRRFLKKVDTRERVTALQVALDKILADSAGIRAKRWWTREELDKPGR